MKIGMVSSWHVHAPDYAKQIQSRDTCKITAIWDEIPERGLKWAAELGCTYYEEYDAFLKADTDGVVICSPTNLHPELMIKAAQAKKHIFTEKVLCLQLEDAMKIKKAIEDNGILFTISYPQKCVPAMIQAKKMVEDGELGQITYARVRNVHNGSIANWLPDHFYNKEQCGGGAMVDLGAHPMYLLLWLLGEPKKVQSTFTNITNRAVEDNAVSVIEFKNGAIGVSETGFVSVYNPLTVEISGTKGCILIHDGFSYATEKTQGKWTSCTDLPERQESPVLQWIDSLESGKFPEQFGIGEAVNLTKLMEAAYQASRSGEKILL
jgi:Predicted dehydrogenases and related proteins